MEILTLPVTEKIMSSTYQYWEYALSTFKLRGRGLPWWPRVKTSPSIAGDEGLIPGHGPKIPCALGQKKKKHTKKHNQYCKNLIKTRKQLKIRLRGRSKHDKGPYSQSYGFSSSHVRIWELDHKEDWKPKHQHFRTVMVEKTPGQQGAQTSQS